MTRTNSIAAAQDDVRLIAADQLADMLDVSTRTVWRLLSAGRLIQPIRIGGSVRWRLNEVREWIAKGCPAVSS
jgi:excisionase family DNA binding protein